MHLLKEKNYPYIIIGIPRNELNLFKKKDTVVIPDVTITLTNVTKSYKIECLKENCSKKSLTITGNQKLKLTGFDLTPPEKFYGFVKVKNDVVINFKFAFQFL